MAMPRRSITLLPRASSLAATSACIRSLSSSKASGFGQNRGAEVILEFWVAAHVLSGLFLLCGLYHALPELP